MVLVVLSVVEQRLDAVRAVLAGGTVVEVAARVGVSRSTLHRWLARNLVEQLAGLADQSHRPKSCPHQVADAVEVEVEVEVVEMRRSHPRWGSRRIRLELIRKPVFGVRLPAERTIDRILTRRGLSQGRPRKRPKSSYVRWERAAPMQLWQVDIVGGIQLVDAVTGVVREAKVVTGVDDHSRFCVMSMVVEHATSRAVCLAFAQALARFGVPEEVNSDNGKQFTNRFGKGNGEVLFDKICRKNGIGHRLTAPASPNQNGKVERFHGTFRPDFLDVEGPFLSVEEASAAVDAWVLEYNTDRPHQGLDASSRVTPSQRFTPVSDEERDLLQLWLPAALASGTAAPPPGPDAVDGDHIEPGPAGGIELDKLIPPSGNLTIGRQQFWLGPVHAGKTVHVWADTDVVHLMIGAARVKTVRSHLRGSDLALLLARGAAVAGDPPIPRPERGDAIEVERVVSRSGSVALGRHRLLAAEILGGRAVGIRIEPALLMFFDLETRQLLRVRPNPLSTQETSRLRGARAAGPPPRPSSKPVTVQRRASATGVILVCRQPVSLGRIHAGEVVDVAVSETTIAVDLGEDDTLVVSRTTTLPVRNIKALNDRRLTPRGRATTATS